MKKLLGVVILLTICLFCVSALQNTYTSESREYRLLMYLCDIAETRPANMVSPLSGDQMLQILSTIPYDRLSLEARKHYDSLKESFGSPELTITHEGWDGGIGLDFDLSGQVFLQAEHEYDFLVEKKDRKPFVKLGVDIFFNDYVYAYIDADLTDIDNSYIGSGLYGRFTTNFPKGGVSVDGLDCAFPHRAFASVGYKGMNLIAGRDRLGLGQGMTGNLTLGNNFWYEDFVKASILSGPLSYDFLIISFENSKGDGLDSLDILTDTDSSQMKQTVFLHNLSYRPLDRLCLTISEGCLTYGDKTFMDLRKLNPFMIMHNIFDYANGANNSGNMNNFFSFEAAASLPYGISLDFQAAFDQIQMAVEKNPDNSLPAQGFLFNVKRTRTMLGGIASYYLEAVYTSANLYLKEEAVECHEHWNLDLLVGKKLYWSPSGVSTLACLGYKGGPDSFVLGTGFSWENLDGLKLDFSALYRIHGKQGVCYYEGQNDKAITYGESTGGLITGEHDERRLVLDLKAVCPVTEYLSLELETGFIHAENYHNQSGETFNSFQASFAVTISPDLKNK